MSNKIKCVIIDDEPFARKGLQRYVECTSSLELIGIGEDVDQLNQFLKLYEIDLLFLDIEMPRKSGIDFLMEQNLKPLVILTTAYEQYALKGFELNILDYLLKPISIERFSKAVEKAIHYLELLQRASTDYIFVNTGQRLEKIIFSEIRILKATENYVTFILEDRQFLSHTTLQKIVSKLPQDNFVQVHKSFVVSIKDIQSMDTKTIKISDHIIPIGKTYKSEFKKKLKS